MSLKKTLHVDLTNALKARNELTVSVLRSVIGAVQSAEKAGKTAVEFNDEEVLNILRKQIKQRRESAQIYADAKQIERSEREENEARILDVYVPADLSDGELEMLVRRVVSTFENPDKGSFGAIMKAVVSEIAGRADGKRISEKVRSLL